VKVGTRGHKVVDKDTKDVEETSQSFDQTLSGTATLENTRLQWQSAIGLQYHTNAATDWKYQPLFAVNFVKLHLLVTASDAV